MLLYNDKNVFSQKLLSNTASAISKNLPRHAHSTFYFFPLLHCCTSQLAAASVSCRPRAPGEIVRVDCTHFFCPSLPTCLRTAHCPARFSPFLIACCPMSCWPCCPLLPLLPLLHAVLANITLLYLQ